MDGRLEPDADEHRVLDAVVAFTRGRLFNTTGPELARHLNERGYVNRDGRPWNRTTALRLARRMAQRPVVGAAS